MNAKIWHVSRFWGINNKGCNRKIETFPFSASKVKERNL